MVDAHYDFIDPEQAEAEDFPETYIIESLEYNRVVDFFGVKIGDVNGSANNFAGNTISDTRNEKTYFFELKERNQDEIFVVDFIATEDIDVSGLQMALNWDGRNVLDLTSNIFEVNEQNYFMNNRGLLNISMYHTDVIKVKKGDVIFSVSNPSNIRLDEVTVSKSGVQSELYVDYQLNTRPLDVGQGLEEVSSFTLHQNAPNPWRNETNISFDLDVPGDITLKLFAADGKLLYEHSAYYETGSHGLAIKAKDLGTKGIIFYELSDGKDQIVRRMLLLE